MPIRILPLLILLLAAALRLIAPGLWTTWGDELNIINAAIGIVERGQWTWVGNESSFGGLAAHSPFTTYITAAFGLIAPHPLVMRTGYALQGLVTVALMYAVVRRHFGNMAALIAMTLCAVMPMPVYWSRFVWNPNIAPLFILIWIHTGILAYQHGHQRARWLHWLALTFAIQSQTALAMLIPISAGLLCYALITSGNQLKIVRDHLLIFLICAVTCLPWVFGLYGVSQGWWQPAMGVGNFDSGALAITIPSVERLLNEFALITASVGYWRGNLNAVTDAPSWWFISDAYFVLMAQAMIVFVALLSLAGQRKKRVTSWFLIVTVLLPFSILFINRQLSDFYMMAAVYAGIIVLSHFAGRLIQQQRGLIVFVILFAGSQLWLTLSMIDWHSQQASLWTYGDVIDLVDGWHDNTYDVVIWEYDPASSAIEAHKWRTHWQILSASYPVRYITSPAAIPIASEQRFVITQDDPFWQDRLTFDSMHNNPERAFAATVITPETFGDVTHTPQSASKFNTLAQIIGLHDTADGVRIIWQPLTATTVPYQFSLRVVNDAGEVVAQHDQSSLQAALWREGDTVISFMPRSHPVTDSESYQLVMYPLEGGQPLSVMDDNGNASGVIMRFTRVDDNE